MKNITLLLFHDKKLNIFEIINLSTELFPTYKTCYFFIYNFNPILSYSSYRINEFYRGGNLIQFMIDIILKFSLIRIKKKSEIKSNQYRIKIYFFCFTYYKLKIHMNPLLMQKKDLAMNMTTNVYMNSTTKYVPTPLTLNKPPGST